jgi:hypothetical protein
MLLLPLGDSLEPVPDPEGATRGRRHPGGYADTILLGGTDDVGVDVAGDRDGELRSRVSARHDETILPR